LRKQKLFVWILVPWLLLMVAGNFIFRDISRRNFEAFSRKTAERELREQAQFLEWRYEVLGEVEFIEMLGMFREALGNRVTLIDAAGQVKYDSHEDYRLMENHGGRPEVVEAVRESRPGINVRLSSTVNVEMIYLARPVYGEDGSLRLLIRVAAPFRNIEEQIARYLRQTTWSFAFILILLILLAYYMSRFISKPLEDIRVGAEKIAGGSYDLRLQPRGAVEMEKVAESFNHMSSHIRNDIERLEKLERIRRDFVANVSHELKTPITTIQGYSETLLDSWTGDEGQRAFLKTVLKNAKRMNAIINDLIELAKLERDGGEMPKRETVMLRFILEQAAENFREAAAAKSISVEIRGDEGMEALINPPLMEQALGNIIDNAVKYSGEGGRVLVDYSRADGEISIRISDRGVGIPEEAIPRIFERFYRVDKGRSRKEGGTGLGLAICKHIIQVHGGDIEVKSRPGEGTTFTVRLPDQN